MSPQERQVFQITFKYLMARFLERFKGEGLREKNLSIPEMFAESSDVDLTRQIILVDKLGQYQDFLGPYSAN